MKSIYGQNIRAYRSVVMNGESKPVVISTTRTHLMVYKRLNDGSAGELIASSAVQRPCDFDFDALLLAACGKNQLNIGVEPSKKRVGKAASRGNKV